ncbi:hypothetical protein UCRPC4_g02847 [Phaeomoniella chlamydospora]|uniref:Uncharacterized protein n=1 Tax=Phaeomoniella chlamydospora TaxID=158046 RepID=A0A0G2EMM1_PHACM|nr:hypothetical protein UCRPC4_g02847 [Phaeomoniella chlamydospora]
MWSSIFSRRKEDRPSGVGRGDVGADDALPFSPDSGPTRELGVSGNDSGINNTGGSGKRSPNAVIWTNVPQFSSQTDRSRTPPFLASRLSAGHLEGEGSGIGVPPENRHRRPKTDILEPRANSPGSYLTWLDKDRSAESRPFADTIVAVPYDRQQLHDSILSSSSSPSIVTEDGGNYQTRLGESRNGAAELGVDSADFQNLVGEQDRARPTRVASNLAPASNLVDLTVDSDSEASSEALIPEWRTVFMAFPSDTWELGGTKRRRVENNNGEKSMGSYGDSLVAAEGDSEHEHDLKKRKVVFTYEGLCPAKSAGQQFREQPLKTNGAADQVRNQKLGTRVLVKTENPVLTRPDEDESSFFLPETVPPVIVGKGQTRNGDAGSSLTSKSNEMAQLDDGSYAKEGFQNYPYSGKDRCQLVSGCIDISSSDLPHPENIKVEDVVADKGQHGLPVLASLGYENGGLEAFKENDITAHEGNPRIDSASGDHEDLFGEYSIGQTDDDTRDPDDECSKAGNASYGSNCDPTGHREVSREQLQKEDKLAGKFFKRSYRAIHKQKDRARLLEVPKSNGHGVADQSTATLPSLHKTGSSTPTRHSPPRKAQAPRKKRGKDNWGGFHSRPQLPRAQLNKENDEGERTDVRLPHLGLSSQGGNSVASRNRPSVTNKSSIQAKTGQGHKTVSINDVPTVHYFTDRPRKPPTCPKKGAEKKPWTSQDEQIAVYEQLLKPFRDLESGVDAEKPSDTDEQYAYPSDPSISSEEGEDDVDFQRRKEMAMKQKVDRRRASNLAERRSALKAAPVTYDTEYRDLPIKPAQPRRSTGEKRLPSATSTGNADVSKIGHQEPEVKILNCEKALQDDARSDTKSEADSEADSDVSSTFDDEDETESSFFLSFIRISLTGFNAPFHFPKAIKNRFDVTEEISSSTPPNTIPSTQTFLVEPFLDSASASKVLNRIVSSVHALVKPDDQKQVDSTFGFDDVHGTLYLTLQFWGGKKLECFVGRKETTYFEAALSKKWKRYHRDRVRKVQTSVYLVKSVSWKEIGSASNIDGSGMYQPGADWVTRSTETPNMLESSKTVKEDDDLFGSTPPPISDSALLDPMIERRDDIVATADADLVNGSKFDVDVVQTSGKEANTKLDIKHRSHTLFHTLDHANEEAANILLNAFKARHIGPGELFVRESVERDLVEYLLRINDEGTRFDRQESILKEGERSDILRVWVEHQRVWGPRV